MNQQTYHRGYGDLGFQLRELANHLDVKSFQALSPGIGIGEPRPRSNDVGNPVRRPAGASHQESGFRSHLEQTRAAETTWELPEHTPMQRRSEKEHPVPQSPEVPFVEQSEATSPQRKVVAKQHAMKPSRKLSIGNPLKGFRGKAARQASQLEQPEATVKANILVRAWRGFWRFSNRGLALVIDMAIVLFCMAAALAGVSALLTLGENRESFWMEGGPLKWLNHFEYWELGVVVLGVFCVYFGLFKLVAGKTFGTILADVGQKLPGGASK